MKKIIFIVVVAAVVVGAGAFYAGTKYGQSRVSRGPVTGANFAGNVRLGGERMNAGGFASGEIIARDDKSITVKLRDGGSKIIFYSETTEIGKMASGTPADLGVGQTVTVNGKTNQDGSVTAQSIQLRPIVVPVP